MTQIRSHLGLRGCAALLVVLYHVHFLPNHLPFEDWTAFFSRGYLMVDLFFLLSGFIMSYVYGGIEPNLKEYWHFISRRLARIYPLHLACLLFFVLVEITLFWLYTLDGRNPEPFWLHSKLWQSFLAQLFLVHAFLPSAPGWNIPSWSISAELFAYLLFPVAIVFLRRRPFLATIFFATFIGSYYAAVSLTSGSLDVTHGTAPLRCLSGFLLGMLIHRYGGSIGRVTDRFVSLAQISSLIAIILFLCIKVNDVLLIGPFAILVAATMDDRGTMSRLLAKRPFQFLGEISYSIYLTHVPLIALLYPPFLAVTKRIGFGPMAERALWLIVAIGVVLIFSLMTYRTIEMPARSWLTGKARRRRQVFA